jgi:hypothetical protein
MRSNSAIRVARRASAFTLAEVLAALAFMAIVIPVAIEALHVATLSGEVAERKAEAARVAERILNETIVSTNWNQASQGGKVTEGFLDFDWSLRNEPWSENPMRLITVEVKYAVRGKDYSVQLSTLADGSVSSAQAAIAQ